MNSIKFILSLTLVALAASQEISFNGRPKGQIFARGGPVDIEPDFSTGNLMNNLPLRQPISRAGQFLGGLGQMPSEVRDTLRQQGLTDQQILEKFMQLATQLRKERLEGARPSDLLRSINRFIEQNGLEQVQKKYSSIIGDVMRQRAQEYGLGQLESKVEQLVKENGGIANTVSKAEENWQSAGGLDGLVDRAVDIARQEGPSGLQSRLRAALTQWGLQDMMQRMNDLLQNMLSMVFQSPFGTLVNLFAQLSGNSGSMSGMGGLFNNLLGSGYGDNFYPGQGTNGFASNIRQPGSGFIGSTLGSGMESIARTPLDVSNAMLRPFSIIPGVNLARGAISGTSQLIG